MVHGFLGHGVSLMVSQVAYALLSFLAISLATRLLGPSNYGSYSLFLNVGTIFAIFSHTWLQNGIYKYCVDQQAQSQSIGEILGTGMVLLFFSWVAVTGLVLIFRVPLLSYLGIHGATVYFIPAYLIMTSSSMLVTYVFRSLGAFKSFSLLLPVERIIFLACLAFVYFRGEPVTSAQVIFFLLISHLVFVVIGLMTVDLKHLLPLRVRIEPIGRILAFSWPYIFTSLVSFGGQSVEVFLVDFFLDRENLGIYSLGLQFLNIGAQILLVFNTVLTQAFIALVKEGRDQAIERFYARIVPQVIFAMLFLMVIAMMAFPYFFTLFFPEKFSKTAGLVLQFFSPIFSFAIFTLLHPLLFAHEKTAKITWINLVPLLVTLPLYFIFVQSAGLHGVALIRSLFYLGVALLAIRWVDLKPPRSKWTLFLLLAFGQGVFLAQEFVYHKTWMSLVGVLFAWWAFARAQAFPTPEDQTLLAALRLPRALIKKLVGILGSSQK